MAAGPGRRRAYAVTAASNPPVGEAGQLGREHWQVGRPSSFTRHFDSKTDLYRAVLERACDALAATAGTGDYHPSWP